MKSIPCKSNDMKISCLRSLINKIKYINLKQDANKLAQANINLLLLKWKVTTTYNLVISHELIRRANDRTIKQSKLKRVLCFV